MTNSDAIDYEMPVESDSNLSFGFPTVPSDIFSLAYSAKASAGPPESNLLAPVQVAQTFAHAEASVEWKALNPDFPIRTYGQEWVGPIFPAFAGAVSNTGFFVLTDGKSSGSIKFGFVFDTIFTGSSPYGSAGVSAIVTVNESPKLGYSYSEQRSPFGTFRTYLDSSGLSIDADSVKDAIEYWRFDPAKSPENYLGAGVTEGDIFTVSVQVDMLDYFEVTLSAVASPGTWAQDGAVAVDSTVLAYVDPFIWVPDGVQIVPALSYAYNGNPLAGTGAESIWATFYPTAPPPDGSAPEPTTLALFGLGLAGLGAVRRKKMAA